MANFQRRLHRLEEPAERGAGIILIVEASDQGLGLPPNACINLINECGFESVSIIDLTRIPEQGGNSLSLNRSRRVLRQDTSQLPIGVRVEDGAGHCFREPNFAPLVKILSMLRNLRDPAEF